MKINLSLLALVGCLLLSASLSGALAQPQIPDCGRSSACSSLVEQGQAQSSAGNLSEALRLYKMAYDTEADPALLFNIARLLHKQGSLDTAVSYYQKFLASGLQDLEQRRRAQEYLSQLQASAPTPAPVTLNSLESPQATPPGPQSRPVYKKWWFWTILGTVAAAGIAGGIAGGLTASQPPCPAPCFVFKSR